MQARGVRLQPASLHAPGPRQQKTEAMEDIASP